MAAVCKSYAAQVEGRRSAAAAARKRRGATATEVMITASGLLQVPPISAVFELGMWQSWTGR